MFKKVGFGGTTTSGFYKQPFRRFFNEKGGFQGGGFEASRRPKTDTIKNCPYMKLLIESPDPILMVKQQASVIITQ